MRKQKWKKLGAVLLCMVLIFTNSICAENHVSASEIETGIVDVEDMDMVENPGEDDVEEKDTKGVETDTEDVELENEEEKIEDIEQESKEEEIEESDSRKPGNGTQEKDEEKEKTENEATDIENSELENEEEKIENSDSGKSENEVHEKEEEKEDNIVKDSISENAERESKITVASGIIASGNSNYIEEEDITWVIDADGKLTVEGTGMYLTGGVAPWENYKQFVTSAEINVTGAIRAADMFHGCANLVNVDLSNFDTSEITDMSSMFCGCYSLIDVDLSNFETGNVTNMSQMFANCNSLTNLDLSSFDTSNVIYMAGMFSSCTKLISLDLSSFNTSNVTSMYQMFYFCKNLSNLDLSNFNTSNVDGSMGFMFQGCDSLVCLDLSNFDVSQVTNMYAMLDCDNLTTVYTPRNVQGIVTLPGTNSGDIWYRSDGTVVTELPQNLSYSVALGRNYIPEERGTDIGTTPDKAEIVSNIKVSKDKSAVQIVDAKTNKPVSGARVWVGAEYWTDENGVVELNNTGLTTIQIEKDGYNKKTAKKRLVKGEPAVIVICPATGDVEILTASLNLAGEDEDVLNNTVYLSHRNMEEGEGNSATFTLTVESAGKPAKYQLIQNGKILQENTEGIFSLSGKYINHSDGSISYYVDSFDAGYEVYVWVFDSNGNWKTKKLGIRVSEESSLTMQIKEQNSKGTVNLGNDSLKVTIPNSVPIVGGSELNFGFSEKLPVAINISNSGKVRIALNMGDFNTSNSAAWNDKKQEYNNLANRAESLWNSAAAFGGTPSSFGAGMFSVKGNIIGYGEGYLDDSTDRLCVNVGVIMSVIQA